MREMWTLLENIPATFWGVIIGAFFSLGGVALTNRANDRRLRAQLTHDRQLKDRERELSLRKDIYLSAAEAISAGLMTVGRFANLDVPNDQLTAVYLDKSPSIAKVHVIAREKTAREVAAFTGELSSVFLRLFAKRIPLIAQKQQLALLKEQMGSFGKERDRMLDLMKQYNLDGTNDERRWKFLDDTFQFEQRRITETSQQHDKVAATFYAAQLTYMQECTDANAHLTRLLIPIVVAVREELDLPIDEATYRQVIEGGLLQQQNIVREFVEHIRASTAARIG